MANVENTDKKMKRLFHLLKFIYIFPNNIIEFYLIPTC